VSAKKNSQDAKWGATCQLPSLTALLSVLPVVLFCFLFAFVPVPDAHAAAAGYLADENGETEIYVDVDDEFQVVLYLVDITDLAGYECKITVSGPATPIGSAVHGEWFADGHTVFDGIDPVPADYHTAMLLSPMSISGSGAVVVFTLRADDDGIVAINVDGDYFLFAESDGDVIELDLPSTLYVTVGTGEGLLRGGESEQDADDESEGFLDSTQYTLSVQSTGVQSIPIVAGPGQPYGGFTNYTKQVDGGALVTLTAPVSHQHPTSGTWYAFHHWTIGATIQPTGDCKITFEMPDDALTVTATYVRNVRFVGTHEGDLETIQSAVDAVDPGGVVIVRSSEDEYTGSGNWDIDFHGKGILLRSEAGPDTCTIKGSNGHRAFYFHSGETHDAVVYGFRIRGCFFGEYFETPEMGGAIYCTGTAGPTIAFNTIGGPGDYGEEQNTAMSGGGIAHDSSGTIWIRGNTISDNHAVGWYDEAWRVTVGGAGGGVYATGPVLIERNLICFNASLQEEPLDGRAGGGGICCVDGQISDNHSISGYTIGDAPWTVGGGIACFGGAVITRNGISGAVQSLLPGHGGGGYWDSTGRGGGLYVGGQSAANITDNQITGGRAAVGGGAYIQSSHVSFVNNVVAKNCALQQGGGIAVCALNPSFTSIQFDYLTVVYNSGHWGGSGIFFDGWPYQNLAAEISNSIVYGNNRSPFDNPPRELEQITLQNSDLVLTYCDVQHGVNGIQKLDGHSEVDFGAGCFDADPLVEPYRGYHLCSVAGRWDPLDKTWVQDATTSPCIDAGDRLAAYDSETDPNGGRVNIGAYGNRVTASRSLVSVDFVVADPATGATNFTRSNSVTVATLSAVPSAGETIDGYKITDNHAQPDPQDTWDSTPPTSYALDTFGFLSIMIHGWARDTADKIGAKAVTIYRTIDGDANLDCRVNILDLIFIRNRINEPVDSNDKKQADVNADGRINILDLIFVRNKLAAECGG